MKRMVLLTADSNGAYPVPAVNGGAVPTLIEHLVQDNENAKVYDLAVISFYDDNAKRVSEAYKKTKFIWVKVPRVFKFGDKVLFKFIRKYFPKLKSLSYRSIFSLLFYIVRSHIILKKFNYDDVIIENNIPLTFSMWGLTKKYHGRYYYHLHNVPRVGSFGKKIITEAAGYLCVSNYVGDQIKQIDNPFGPVDGKKVKTLRNCIDTRVFNDNINWQKLSDIRRRFKFSAKDKIILFTGRISEEKGIDQLIRAFHIAHKTDNRLKLMIVGSYLHGSNIKDSYQKYLNKLSEDLKDSIIYTGYVDQSDLKYYYQIASISVLPSMWDEPAGLTMLESMSCGTPVITTYSGGIPEYVENKAIVLKRDDNLANEIAKKIIYLLNNSKIYDKYVDEGKVLVKEKYSSTGYIYRLQQAINQI